jgi:hypothetical protein
MSRGNERRNIFRQDGDYRKLLAIIKKADGIKPNRL